MSHPSSKWAIMREWMSDGCFGKQKVSVSWGALGCPSDCLHIADSYFSRFIRSPSTFTSLRVVKPMGYSHQAPGDLLAWVYSQCAGRCWTNNIRIYCRVSYRHQASEVLWRCILTPTVLAWLLGALSCSTMNHATETEGLGGKWTGRRRRCCG